MPPPISLFDVAACFALLCAILRVDLHAVFGLPENIEFLAAHSEDRAQQSFARSWISAQTDMEPLVDDTSGKAYDQRAPITYKSGQTSCLTGGKRQYARQYDGVVSAPISA